ncbi:hypothetical protein DIPPA_65250 [Diplonema papillatum]|nr:hypothetical protein DIPPA_65250 [Diplonema papillatum]
MLLAVAVSAALLIAGLPSEKIRASGEKCSDAVRRDMNRAVLLLNKAQAVALAEYEKPDKFPSFYRALDGEVRALTEAPDGNGGAISVFFGSANGALDGISWGAGKYEILKGNPRDTSGRGSLEVYSVSENAESWDLSDLKSNTSFNLAEHAWFITAPTIKWTSPYVFKQDTYASSIGITLSKGVFKDGNHIGTVGVDIDLSFLDMVVGPLRPAPGAEVVLADPTENTIIASTIPAARLIRISHKKVNCFDTPFAQIFNPIAHSLGGLERAARMGPVLLRAEHALGSLLKWDAVYTRPVQLPGETLTSGPIWLLVVTDDSERRADSCGQSQPMLFLVVASVVAYLFVS